MDEIQFRLKVSSPKGGSFGEEGIRSDYHPPFLSSWLGNLGVRELGPKRLPVTRTRCPCTRWPTFRTPALPHLRLRVKVSRSSRIDAVSESRPLPSLPLLRNRLHFSKEKGKARSIRREGSRILFLQLSFEQTKRKNWKMERREKSFRLGVSVKV